MKWADTCGFRVRSENCITFLGLESVPEPDLVWVKRKRYRKAHPTATDVGLVIEVADSSLREDRGEMAELYADAGIGEYWIVNCVDQVVEIHRQPTGGRYQVQFVVKPGEQIGPLVAPAALLDVAELFAEE
jgi:Uma2 family endonuclease